MYYLPKYWGLKAEMLNVLGKLKKICLKLLICQHDTVIFAVFTFKKIIKLCQNSQRKRVTLFFVLIISLLHKVIYLFLSYYLELRMIKSLQCVVCLCLCVCSMCDLSCNLVIYHPRCILFSHNTINTSPTPPRSLSLPLKRTVWKKKTKHITLICARVA